MLKKSITYEDFDGIQRTEDFYFNLTKAELLKWITTTGDYSLDKVILRLAKENNGKKIIELIDSLIKTAYGEKSIDGRRIVKNEEVWNNFYESEAYSVLFMELVSDSRNTAKFIQDIIPKEYVESIAEEFKKNPDGIPAEMRQYIPRKE